MKIKVIGCGNAFSNLNFNQVFLLEENGQRMLVDCGYQTGAALYKAGVDLKSITDIYISHAHADHIGFLEGIGFQRYDWKNKPKIQPHDQDSLRLHANNNLMKELWDNSLSGGMKCIEGIDSTLNTFFDLCPVIPGNSFVFGDWNCELVQQIHIMSGSYISNTFGLFMTHGNGKIVYFTTDSQHCSPRQVEVFYKKADIIFQDCECIGVNTEKKVMEFMSGVHANYAQLAGWESANSVKLSPEIKSKMWLTHYQDFVTEGKDNFGKPCDWQEMAKAEGFKGFVTVGQEIEL